MENEKEFEENSENSSQEETSAEETSQEEVSNETSKPEDHTSDKGELASQYTEREKQLFERAKKAEAKNKLFERLEKKVEKSSETPVEDIARTVHALKDYSAEEVGTIFKQAKALGVSPLEALKDEDVNLLIQAKREKVAKSDKTPEPTNRQSIEEKPFSEWKIDDIESSNVDKLSKFYDWMKSQE